jgi:hypothetical protein
VPALIAGESESTLLDVPDAPIALQKWTGQVKIIGPISEVQMMACAFAVWVWVQYPIKSLTTDNNVMFTHHMS